MSEDNDKTASKSESKSESNSESRSRNTSGNTSRNKRIKTALIAAFVLVMFVFSGIVIYIYLIGQDNSPAAYYVASEQSVQITETRTIETADDSGVNNNPVLNEDAAGYNSGAYGGDSAYDFLQLKKEPKESKVLSTGCINEFTFEENCNAPSGCVGTRTKMCINNEWSYTTNCTSNLIKCSHGSCMEQCKDDKNYFIEKYRITNNKTLIFYYADEPHSDAMLPFMQSMERVMLLKYGDDTSFEQYLNLFGTVPSLVCFDNQATTTGEKTQEEVESFKAANC